MPIIVLGFISGFCWEMQRQLEAVANEEELPEESLGEVMTRGFVDGFLAMLGAALNQEDRR